MKYLLVILFFINTTLLGQIKLKDLTGEWISDNTDSLYFKSDTIKFYQAQLYNQSVFTNKINKEIGCRRIGWIIKRKRLNIDNENLCIEPPTTTSYVEAWNIKLIKKTEHQFIKISHITGFGGLFEIVDYQKDEISKKEKDFKEEFEKTLILKRIN